ncbi:MAG: DUF1566 domain-containing protein [Acinetobacter sp.]|nr:MAG: DUF1566 domain-containing protein [Acinetobacter sp.]
MIQNKQGYNCPQNILFQPIKNSWGMYWSISPYTDEDSWYSYLENENDEYYWYLYFENGNIAYNNNLGNAYVRSVRGQAKITLPQHAQTIQKPVQAIAKPQPSTIPTKQPIQPQIVQKPVQPATPTAKPPQQPTIPFSDELDQGVWTDPNTGLMWARISIGQEWKNGKCVSSAKRLDWYDAQKECQNFKLAGFSDWRLPTIDELKTLKLNRVAGYNCPNMMLFQPKKRDWGMYWSISPYTDEYSWYLYFENGNIAYNGNRGNAYVRAVRGKAKNTQTQQKPTVQKTVQYITKPQPSTTPIKQPIQPQTAQKPVQSVTPTAKPTQQPTTPPINKLDQGVWTDPNTGLMWARISIGQQWINGQCVGDAKELNWEDAEKECQNFQLAGFNDWQLPTIDELNTLKLKNTSGTLFPPKSDNWGQYWSASPYKFDNNFTWGTDFHTGYSYGYDENDTYHVRVVRGGTAKISRPKKTIQPVTSTAKPPQQQTTPSSNELDKGVWTDPNTGLMWARISIGQQWENGKCISDARKLDWEDAKKECQNYKLANFNDWRLPTIDELTTLMIQGKSGYNCPKNILFQPNKDSFGYYWSESSNKYAYALYIGFDGGFLYDSKKNSNSHVRAVRGNAKITLPQQKPATQQNVIQSNTPSKNKSTSYTIHIISDFITILFKNFFHYIWLLLKIIAIIIWIGFVLAVILTVIISIFKHF